METMQQLVGQRVEEIWVGPDEDRIHFKTGEGWMCWEAWGDCCSVSWFADIYGTECLFGKTILSAERLELSNDDQHRTRQEVDQVYGIGLATCLGKATIAFRNSSNGYYGGDLTGPTDMAPLDSARQITADWSA